MRLPLLWSAAVLGTLLPSWAAGLVGSAAHTSGDPARAVVIAPVDLLGQVGDPIPCEVGPAGDFRCPTVRGPLGCVVLVDDGAPHFVLSVGSNRLSDLGPVRVPRGASLLGRVDFPRGFESHAQQSWVVARNSSGAEARAPVVSGGFFAVEGLGPGTWELVAEVGAARSAPLRVEDHQLRTTRSLAPIRLVALPFERVADLSISVSPASLGDVPWVATVRSLGSGRSLSTIELDFDGHTHIEALYPGRGHVELRRGEDILASHPIELDRPGIELEIKMSGRPVQGRVEGLREGHQGAVRFGERSRPPTVLLAIDDDGDFAGWLPRTGPWEVWWKGEGLEVAFDQLEIPADPQGTPFELNLELPTARIAGKVVEAGEPVRDAMVVAAGEDAFSGRRSPVAYARSGEDGTFELAYLQAADLALLAYRELPGPVLERVSLRQGEVVDDVVLEIRKVVSTTVRVLDGTAALAGVRVLALQQLAVLAEGRTNGSGTAVLELAPGRWDVFVESPSGFGISPLEVRDGQPEVAVSLLRSAAGVALEGPPADWAAAGFNGASAPLALFQPAGVAGSVVGFEAEQVSLVGPLQPGPWTFCRTDGACCHVGVSPEIPLVACKVSGS